MKNALEACFERVALLPAVAQGQLGVRRVLRFGRVEPEELFDLQDARLLALDLDEEAEGQLVDDDLGARDAPRLTPLLVDERRPVAEGFEDGRQRARVRYLRLLLALTLDGRLAGVALLEREDCPLALASQAEHAPRRVEPRPRVDDVLLELRTPPPLRADVF